MLGVTGTGNGHGSLVLFCLENAVRDQAVGQHRADAVADENDILGLGRKSGSRDNSVVDRSKACFSAGYYGTDLLDGEALDQLHKVLDPVLLAGDHNTVNHRVP